MEVATDQLKSEVKTWLKSALFAENSNDFCIDITGSTEKGDGYIGDILFVDVSTEDVTKNLNLVLKCSKRSQALREQVPVKTIYLNEIYVYKTLLPAFQQFQTEKGVEEPFDSYAKYYGSFISGNMEVLVLENLRKSGYELWDRRTPLNFEHLISVVKQYGKLHAISVAFRKQRPEEFQKIADGLKKVYAEFMETVDIKEFYATHIKNTTSELKDELNLEILNTWEKLIDVSGFIFHDVLNISDDRMKVVTHGDCWNNNFMYHYADGNKTSPSKIAILDWQISFYTTPILDLSYFIFTTISEEDLKNLESILEVYHESFCGYLKELGGDPSEYPLEEFKADWKEFCYIGLIFSNLIIKVCLSEKEEVVNIDEVIERGEAFAETFKNEIKNKEGFRKRMKYIVKYAVENNLI